MELPSGVIEREGRLCRVVEVISPSGEKRSKVRPVSLDLDEARLKRMDYWHPDLKMWILEGYKKERDLDPHDIMADDSVAVGQPREVGEKEETASG